MAHDKSTQMQHTFGLTIPGVLVTSSLDSMVRVRLCGSLPELGSWSIDKAPCLTLQTKSFDRCISLAHEPRFYRLDIQLSTDIDEFQYKYILNDQLWESKENEPRQWTRNQAKYVVNDVYYTPIDYWIDANNISNREVMFALMSPRYC
jgi:hypothetical protein